MKQVTICCQCRESSDERTASSARHTGEAAPTSWGENAELELLRVDYFRLLFFALGPCFPSSALWWDLAGFLFPSLLTSTFRLHNRKFILSVVGDHDKNMVSVG